MKLITGSLLPGVVTTASAQVEIKMREVTANEAQSMLDIGKPKAAREIALQCAARNDADCQMVAAQLLLHGVGGKADDPEALLGNLYIQGIGVKKIPRPRCRGVCDRRKTAIPGPGTRRRTVISKVSTCPRPGAGLSPGECGRALPISGF